MGCVCAWCLYISSVFSVFRYYREYSVHSPCLQSCVNELYTSGNTLNVCLRNGCSHFNSLNIFFSSFSFPPFLFLVSLPLSVCLFLSLCALPGYAAALKSQPEQSRPHIPRLDLERWYQDLMAAGEPSQPCPPPLPAKSTRRPTQVNSHAGTSAFFFFFLPHQLQTLFFPDVALGIPSVDKSLLIFFF